MSQEDSQRVAIEAIEAHSFDEAMRATGPLSRLPLGRQALIVAEILKIVGPEVLKKALRIQAEEKARKEEEKRRMEEFHGLQMERNALIEVWFPKFFPYYAVSEIRAELDANLKKETLKNIVKERDRILKANAEDLGFTPSLKSQALTHLNSIIDERRSRGEDEADSLSLLRRVSQVFRGH